VSWVLRKHLGSHSPAAAALRHLHHPAPGQLAPRPSSVRAMHAVSELFAVLCCVSVCFAVAWAHSCFLVYVFILVDMTCLEGLKVGYEGISERAGDAIEGWTEERLDLHPSLALLLLAIECFAGCVDVQSLYGKVEVEVDVVFGAEEQGQAQPMPSLLCTATLWIVMIRHRLEQTMRLTALHPS